MAKVVKSNMSSSYAVVPDCFGEMRTDRTGKLYSYEPLPICRVPVGHGRTEAQAEEMANEIAGLINRQTRYGILPAGNALAGNTDMECGG